MNFDREDFHGAEAFFGAGGDGQAEWQSLEAVLTASPLFLKASGQAGIAGEPRFDPVASNKHLTEAVVQQGWQKIQVPLALPFGRDWEAGRARTLAEWQFSNYPYLCNNTLRADVVFNEQLPLQAMAPLGGLIIVARSWSIPASNSVLFFEQARAQLTRLAARNFTVPVRLVGLRIPAGATEHPVEWMTYPTPRSRTPSAQEHRVAQITGWATSPTYGDQARLQV